MAEAADGALVAAVALLIVAVARRGLRFAAGLQYVPLGLQLLALIGFGVAALARDGAQGPSLSWLNPLAIACSSSSYPNCCSPPRDRCSAPPPEAGWSGPSSRYRDRPPTGCAPLARETGLWLSPGSLYERSEDGRIHNSAPRSSSPTLTTTRDREMELVCARANAWTNQVYVVNASDPAGVGASAIVDPEGIVRQQAGTGEEILVDVLDLDTVTRVREQGSAGLNRPWAQLARYGERIHLPMYGGTFRTPEWSRNQLPGQATSFGSPR